MSNVPTESIDELWSRIEPTLLQIMNAGRPTPVPSTSTNAPTNGVGDVPPATSGIPYSVYMQTFTDVYDFVISSRDGDQSRRSRCSELYARLDDMMAKSAADIFASLSHMEYIAATGEGEVNGARIAKEAQNLKQIMPSLLALYKQFSSAFLRVEGLMTHLEKRFIRLMSDSIYDKGWLRVSDVEHLIPKDLHDEEERENEISKALQERRATILAQYGYAGGGRSKASRAREERAVACAEAATSLDRIVSVKALANRRFRLQVVQPLLDAPSSHLRRAMIELVDASEDGDKEGKATRLALDELLESVGFPRDHELRRQLGPLVPFQSCCHA